MVSAVTAVPRDVFCPVCMRHLTKAKAITGLDLQCRKCKARLTINLTESRLIVDVAIMGVDNFGTG